MCADLCVHSYAGVGYVWTQKKLKKMLPLCNYCMHKLFLGFYCENISLFNLSTKFEEMFSVTHYGTKSFISFRDYLVLS